MRGILAELRKIWRNRLFLLMTVLLFLVNLFCLYDSSYRNENFSPKEYRKIWKELKENAQGNEQEYLQRLLEEETEDYDRFYLLETIESELSAAYGFRGFVQTLENQKNLITGSVLFRGASAYSIRSAEKANSEYQKAVPPEIKPDASKGIELSALIVTDLLVACAGIFACVVLFMREKEQDMVCLQWTLKHGRGRHLLYKLIALFASAAVLSALFYGGNLLFANAVYGLGDVTRDIRMVETYATSRLNMSVLSWLILCFLGKSFVLYVLLLLCSVFCTCFRSFFSVVVPYTALLLVEYLLYKSIAATSVFASLRYVNLIALFRIDEWLLKYEHIGILNQPVNYYVCALALLTIFFIVGLLLCVRMYLSYGSKMERTGKNDKQKNKREKSREGRSVFLWELWKAGFMQRLLLIFLVLAAVQISLFVRRDRKRVSYGEYYYRIFMNRLEGEVTENTKGLIEQMGKEAMSSGSSEVCDAYQRVLLRYEYLKENGGCFVYDTGYRILTDTESSTNDDFLMLKFLTVLLLFCAAVFSYDPQKRMSGLLHTTCCGVKAVPKSKYLIGLFLSTLSFLMVYVPDFIEKKQDYRMPGGSFPAGSLPWLSEYGDKLSINGYLILLYSIRILMCPLLVYLVMSVAESMKSFVYCFLTCGVVFICLPLISMTKPAWRIISFLLYGVYGNVLLQSPFWVMVIYLGLLCTITLLAKRRRKELWN